MVLKPNQVEFCKLYVSGLTAQQAYQKAYNNNNPGSSAVSATKLLKTPLIQNEIKRLQELNADVVKQANLSKAEIENEADIISRVRRMEILSQIAEGKLKIQRVYGSEMGPVNMEVEPDYADRKNAIAELNKMDGSYAASKTDVNVKGDVKTISIEFVEPTH